METFAPRAQARPGWLPRALVSGFIASAVMLFAFIVSYGIGLVLAGVPLAERRGAEAIQAWFYGLTHNALLDLASESLYAAVSVHFTVGLVWAVVYARVAEPRLRGPSWAKGAIFSLVPWLLSLTVFLPIVGAGFFGSALGAGPLPIIGNLILHLVYGVTLGLVYSPLGDIDVERLVEREPSHLPEVDVDAWAMASSEAMAARGLVIGIALGVVVGVVGVLAAQVQPGARLLGLEPLAFVLATALFGGAFGGLIGSLVGLPSAPVVERSR